MQGYECDCMYRVGERMSDMTGIAGEEQEDMQALDLPAITPGQASARPAAAADPRAQLKLGELGLSGFAPYLMNRVVSRYNAALRSELASLGLTTPKMRAMAVLSVIEGPLIRDLASYTVTEQSTLSRALDGLAAEGLIRREPDPQDSRGIRVYLTPAGRETFERLWPHMAQGYAAMFRGISEDERRGFVATLQKLLANVEQPDD